MNDKIRGSIFLRGACAARSDMVTERSLIRKARPGIDLRGNVRGASMISRRYLPEDWFGAGGSGGRS